MEPQNNRKSSVSPPRLLLFDLGGVLVRLTGVPRMLELTANRYTVAQLWEKWIASPVIRLYESGRMTTGDFGRRIVEEFAMDIAPAKYLEEFTVWPAGKYPGVNDLLEALKQDFTIASLSNTNELHWNRICNEMDFIHLFDFNFPSHLTGLLKPDRETYLNVSGTTGISPDSILFFDDNSVNVDGARNCGLQAVRVDGMPSLTAHLTVSGLLRSR